MPAVEASGQATRDRVEGTAAAAVSFAVVLLYALRGGSFDLLRWAESGVAIWWTIAVGLAVGVLPRAGASRLTGSVAAAFSLLAGWFLLAHGWTESDERTTTEFVRVLHHLGLVLLPALLLSRRTWTWAVFGAMLGGVAVVLVALGSRLTGADVADAGKGSFGGNRLSHPLNYWNAIAAWTTVTASMALAWSAHVRAPALRAVALAAVPVVATCAYLTYSRQALGGMVIGALVVWAVARHRATVLIHLAAAAAVAFVAISVVRKQPQIVDDTGTAGAGEIITVLLIGAVFAAAVAVGTGLVRADERLRLSRRAGRGAAAAAAVVALLAAGIAGPPLVSEAWDEFRSSGETVPAGAPSDPAARLTTLEGNRYQLYRAALRAYESDPVNGIGPGAFQFWWSREGTTPERVRDAHSLFIETLAEAGWPGLLLTLLVIATLLAMVVEARRRAAGAVEVGAATAAVAAVVLFAAHGTIDWLWESTANVALALIPAGAALAGLSRDRGAARARLPLRVGGALAAFAVMLAFLPPMVSLHNVRESQRAVAAGDATEARRAAQDAVDSQPWAATPYLQRALLAEREGRLGSARADIRQAIEREPTNWRHWTVLARVEAQAGETAAALRAWTRARRLLKYPFF